MKSKGKEIFCFPPEHTNYPFVTLRFLNLEHTNACVNDIKDLDIEQMVTSHLFSNLILDLNNLDRIEYKLSNNT